MRARPEQISCGQAKRNLILGNRKRRADHREVKRGKPGREGWRGTRLDLGSGAEYDGRITSLCPSRQVGQVLYMPQADEVKNNPSFLPVTRCLLILF